MTEDEKIMEQYGISCEQKTMYRYKGHMYERLKDALGYAKIDSEREHQSQRSQVQ